jgi:hypothetical protein
MIPEARRPLPGALGPRDEQVETALPVPIASERLMQTGAGAFCCRTAQQNGNEPGRSNP